MFTFFSGISQRKIKKKKKKNNCREKSLVWVNYSLFKLEDNCKVRALEYTLNGLEVPVHTGEG